MNWNMTGHEWAVNLLRQHVSQRRFRHAYLLTGPRGIGRRTLALRFAQAVNCQQPPAPGEACRVCRNCVQIERMQHPDLAVVQAEQISGTLKVDQIRELQRSLALAPYEASYRIALLLRFEEAHISAANALLKTLEEPPTQVILVLTAESGESLLPTITSRCEILRLRPLPIDSVSQALQVRWNIPPEQARLLAHLSNGRPGYALKLSQDSELMNQRSTALADHHKLLACTRPQRFHFAEKLAKDKELLRKTLEIWLSLWRDILLRASGSSAQPTNLDQLEEIENLANTCGLQTAHRMVVSLQKSLQILERNINSRLALEILMLDLPKK